MFKVETFRSTNGTDTIKQLDFFSIKPLNQSLEFIRYFNLYQKELSNYCRALMTDAEDAKDLMSETVLAAIEGFDKILDKEKFKYYLFGIASRLYKKKLRRKKILQFTMLELAQNKESSLKSDDAASLNMLYKSINKLKRDQAEAIVLFEISGFSLNEVADIMKINLSTVKSNIYRGRKKLETMLQPDRDILNAPIDVFKTKTAIS